MSNKPTRYYLSPDAVEAIDKIKRAHFHDNATAAIKFAIYQASLREQGIAASPPGGRGVAKLVALDDESLRRLASVPLAGDVWDAKSNKLSAALVYAAKYRVSDPSEITTNA